LAAAVPRKSLPSADLRTVLQERLRMSPDDVPIEICDSNSGVWQT
jgi:hypothetical protein